MSYGQSNIILPMINIFTYIYVIHKLICDILDIHLGIIQLQFTAIYGDKFCVHERHPCEENSFTIAHAQSMGYI